MELRVNLLNLDSNLTKLRVNLWKSNISKLKLRMSIDYFISLWVKKNKKGILVCIPLNYYILS